MDDGYYVGNSIEAEEVWKTIELHGPMFGFLVNNKSKALIKTDALSCTTAWPHGSLRMSNEGLEVLGVPIGSDTYVSNYTKEKFSNLKRIIEKLN